MQGPQNKVWGCEVHPGASLKKGTCSTCFGKFDAKTKRYVKRSGNKHAHKYNYWPTTFIDSHAKVAICCPTHGVFRQAAYSHKNGHGCPPCGSGQASLTKRKPGLLSASKEVGFPVSGTAAEEADDTEKSSTEGRFSEEPEEEPENEPEGEKPEDEPEARAEESLEETWAAVKGFPHYKVSSRGRISGPNGITKRTDYVFEAEIATRANKYVSATIKGSHGRYVSKLVHCLTAEAHVKNRRTEDDVKRKTVVHHLNGFRWDNRASNLWWVTPKKNARKKLFPNPGGLRQRVRQLNKNDGHLIKIWPSLTAAAKGIGRSHSGISIALANPDKSCGNFRWERVEEEVIEGEKWTTVSLKGRLYTVSSAGRIRVTTGAQAGMLSRGSNSNGYLAYNGAFVHILVALGFPHLCKKGSGPEINHEDGFKTNNAASNLRRVTRQGNMIHAYETGLHASHTRPVDQHALDGTFIAAFPTIAAAQKATKARMISEALPGGKKLSSGGFMWRDHVDNPGPIAPIANSQRWTAVGQYGTKGKLLCVFPSIAEAGRHMHTSDPSKLAASWQQQISEACRRARGSSGRLGEFIWAFFEQGQDSVKVEASKPKQRKKRVIREVNQLDAEMRLVKTFKNASVAGRAMHKADSSKAVSTWSQLIVKACQATDGFGKVGKFYFRYHSKPDKENEAAENKDSEEAEETESDEEAESDGKE